MIVRNPGNPSEGVFSKLRSEYSKMLKDRVGAETANEAEWKGKWFFFRTVIHQVVT